jgi:hypothetical protein
MILKGNQRGGGQQLAAHLMNSFDNERVEIADVRGAIAQDLSGAFAEWSAQGQATKIRKKYYYSLSLNPDQAQGHLSREQYFELIARTERSLKLVGQPRAVVFHEKRDDHGVPREHCHVVWSRVDMRDDKIKAVEISHDRLKLRTVARQFCRDHGLELPNGMKPGKSRNSRVGNFNTGAQENLGERQQKERTGIPKDQRMADIAGCWRETGDDAAFVQAMKAKGYYLAQGDSRDYVVVDLHGEVHSLSRQLGGVAKAKELRNRLSAYPPGRLPDVQTTTAFLAQKRKDAISKAVAQKQSTGPTPAELRRQVLDQHQQQRREKLDHIRTNLITRHEAERGSLKMAQHEQNTGIAGARLQKQPRGFMAFLTRVTGIKMIVEKVQDKARAAAQQKQTAALQRTHDRELHDMDRRYRALERLEMRENRSAETALNREQFQDLLKKKPPARVLKIEFEKALASRKVADTGFSKGELQAAFERATSARTRAGDTGEGGPAPARAERPDKPRAPREEFRNRPPRPVPDKDREH